jgi:phage tail sheath protein FI
MPQYLSPGVYVEEVPPAARPIAGVGTSTAGFIGIVPDSVYIPVSREIRVTDEEIGTGDGSKVFSLKNYPVRTDPGTFRFKVDGAPVTAELSNDDANKAAKATFKDPPQTNKSITGDYVAVFAITNEEIGITFDLTEYPVLTDPRTFAFKVNDKPVRAELSSDDVKKASKVTVLEVPPANASIKGDYVAGLAITNKEIGKGPVSINEFNLKKYPVRTDPETFTFRVNGQPVSAKVSNDDPNKVSKVTFEQPPPANVSIKGDYVAVLKVTDEQIGSGDGQNTTFKLTEYPVRTDPETFTFRVNGQSVPAKLSNDDPNEVSKVTFEEPPPANASIAGDYVAVFEITNEEIGITFDLTYPVLTDPRTFTFKVNGKPVRAELSNDDVKEASKVAVLQVPPANASITGDYVTGLAITNKEIGRGPASIKEFNLKKYPVVTDPGTFRFKVNGRPVPAELSNAVAGKISKVTFKDALSPNASIVGDYFVASELFKFTPPVALETAKLCTNFNEFAKLFGGFSTDAGQRKLAHAVFGFFNNGGTRCYVVRIAPATDLGKAIEALAAIDEIAIVTVPGLPGETEQEAVIEHCEKLKDRVAILDGAPGPSDFTKAEIQGNTKDSTFSGLYFPWIKVSDPVEKLMNPEGEGVSFVPPSGHIAGVYARVDQTRGVHKAPANEVILGALDLQHRLTTAQQDGLNPVGVNVIRAFNGNIKIWGARTMGGNAYGEFMYISTRRLFIFLRESIDVGTQFVVFEPNTPALWQRIIRTVSDFLLNQWRAGALFGATPKQAFFVKCDAETNPPEVREAGQVVTEIGVAIVKPAEFVIFRIQQTTGG